MATWTRAYLVSRFIGVGFYQEVFSRLYKIPQDFGGIFQLIFGNKASEAFTQLLSTQIILKRDFIEAEISGNVNAANDNYTKLYQNANDMAIFLASINPFWDETQWRNLMYTYLNRTIEEITTFLTGNYSTNIDIYDRLLTHSDAIGDYLSQGIYNYMIFNQNSNKPTA
jgi:hypothetical protein